MCLFISPNHIQKIACDFFFFEIQFDHVRPQFTVPNRSSVTRVMCTPPSCRGFNGVLVHSSESQQSKREAVLLHSLPYPKAQLHSPTTKLLEMKAQLWQFWVILLDQEGRLPAVLSDPKNQGAAEAPWLCSIRRRKVCAPFWVSWPGLDKVYFSVQVTTNRGFHAKVLFVIFRFQIPMDRPDCSIHFMPDSWTNSLVHPCVRSGIFKCLSSPNMKGLFKSKRQSYGPLLILNSFTDV